MLPTEKGLTVTHINNSLLDKQQNSLRPCYAGFLSKNSSRTLRARRISGVHHLRFSKPKRAAGAALHWRKERKTERRYLYMYRSYLQEKTIYIICSHTGAYQKGEKQIMSVNALLEGKS